MELDRAVAQLEALVETLEREGDERALLLLELVDAIHRPALAELAAGNAGHPLAQALLAMYGLVEVDDLLLVEEALDEVRPYIESHGGEVELVGVEAGVVTVRLSGACQGCAGSAITLRRGIEQALQDRYEGFRELVAVDPEPGPQLIQLEDLRRPQFVSVPAPDHDLAAQDVDGVSVLLARLDGEVYAFRNRCAVDGMPLEGGRLAGAVIVCPWHNCAYDARTGKRVDAQAEPGLAVVPVALDGDAVKVAVNVG